MLRRPFLILLAAVAGTSPLPALAANPQVEFDTTAGKIRVELYPDAAPKTVANFLDYVKAKHYDGTQFHRVIAGFMIQGGGFTPDFKQKPTRPPVVNEAEQSSKAGLLNAPGTIAMARTGDPHSATAQFFINVADNKSLNFRSAGPAGIGYTVFGKVVEGMDVVNKIAAAPKGAAAPGRRASTPATCRRRRSSSTRPSSSTRNRARPWSSSTPTTATSRSSSTPANAPATVANFLQYVRDGHYDNTIFHRVIDGFMIQGGGMEPGMKQKPVRAPIANEAGNGLKNKRYTVAMARTSDPHSATAQFFINVADNDFLDHKGPSPQGWGYCVFGKVVAGQDVVDRIKGVATATAASTRTSRTRTS